MGLTLIPTDKPLPFDITVGVPQRLDTLIAKLDPISNRLNIMFTMNLVVSAVTLGMVIAINVRAQ